MMKPKIPLLLLMCFCLTAMADKPYTQLVIWAKDGNRVAYALDEKPKITFSGTDLVITSNGLEVYYTLSKMARFTYEDGSSASVINLKDDESLLKFDEESLQFPAMKPGGRVTIYTPNGTLVFSKTVSSPAEYAFPLSSLNAGVYMVKVNGLTYKIMKR